MEKLIHLLLPRVSNNQRAKILHSSSLFAISVFLIVFQFGINVYQKSGGVLGFAASISRDEVVKLTNQRRAEAGLPSLSLNETLSSAAFAKGADMINRDYWAHTAPDGKEPWAFFSSAGYRYRYAGENLARDFSSASSAVDAWMASPTHRDNILNPKYKEIGIGIIDGDLAGSETTLIVQFFGARYVDTQKPTIAENNLKPKEKVVEVKQKEIEPTPAPLPATPIPVEVTTIPENDLVLSSTEGKILVSPFVTTKNTSIIVVSVLALVFLVDWFIISKKRIARITGRTFAHVAFLGMIFAILLILKSGKIL
jgi:hypothetical protein